MVDLCACDDGRAHCSGGSRFAVTAAFIAQLHCGLAEHVLEAPTLNSHRFAERLRRARHAQERAQYLHQFVLHASLDAVDEQLWNTTSMHLGVVDKFNNLHVRPRIPSICCFPSRLLSRREQRGGQAHGRGIEHAEVAVLMATYGV